MTGSGPEKHYAEYLFASNRETRKPSLASSTLSFGLLGVKELLANSSPVTAPAIPPCGAAEYLSAQKFPGSLEGPSPGHSFFTPGLTDDS
jgi:hypothetical protein